MKQCTEDDEDTADCPKEFRDDLQFLLIKHFGSLWEFKWSSEENGFHMNVWGWKKEKEDNAQTE